MITECNGDSCAVDLDKLLRSKALMRGGDAAAREKLTKWMWGMEPIDYDAPGSTVRETGV